MGEVPGFEEGGWEEARDGVLWTKFQLAISRSIRPFWVPFSDFLIIFSNLQLVYLEFFYLFF